MKFSKFIPKGIKTFLNTYFKYTNRRKYEPSKIIEIGTPILVNPKYVQIENYVRIQNNVKLITSKAKLTVKKYSAIGEGCVIIPGAHVPTVGLPQYLSTLHINDVQTGITINEDCWIGAEAALLSKCEVGRGAVVGARSVVTKNIPPYAVVVGMPAKIIATRFTLQQVLEHELLLYPEKERFSEEYLKDLFSTKYEGLKAIGISEISELDNELLESKKKELKMYPYT